MKLLLESPVKYLEQPLAITYYLMRAPVEIQRHAICQNTLLNGLECSVCYTTLTPMISPDSKITALDPGCNQKPIMLRALSTRYIVMLI